MDNRPIGVFDSGIGGLTVVDALARALPNESILYVGDTARVPYGNKSKIRIQEFTNEITQWLVDRNSKMIVVACNTASSLALDYIKSKFVKWQVWNFSARQGGPTTATQSTGLDLLRR